MSLPASLTFLCAVAVCAVQTVLAMLASRRTGFTTIQPTETTTRRATTLAAVALGAAACAASLRWPVPDETGPRSVLLLMGLLLFSFAVLRGGAIVGASIGGLLAHASSLPLLLGGRTTQRQATWASGVSGGLAFLVLVSSALLGFFPLLGQVDATKRAEAIAVVGEHALIANLPLDLDEPSLRHLRGTLPFAEVEVSQTPSGELISHVRCENVRLTPREGPAVSCVADQATALRDTLQSFGYVVPPTLAGGPDLPQVPSATVLERILLVQPADSRELEVLRNRLIAAELPASRVISVGEDAHEAGNTSRPFLVATAAALAIATVVAVISLIAGLGAQLMGRAPALRELRIAGVPRRTLTAGVVTQALATVAPAILLGWLCGLLLGTTFLRLNPGDVGIPVSTSGWLALGALSCAPIGALAMHRPIERWAQAANDAP